MRQHSSLAEVRRPVRRIRVAGEVSNIRGLATSLGEGHAQILDRPPAFMPDVTIVTLQRRDRLICVSGKNKARTVMLIRLPDWESTLR